MLKKMVKIIRAKGYEGLSLKHVDGPKIRCETSFFRLQPNKSCDMHSLEKIRRESKSTQQLPFFPPVFLPVPVLLPL